MSWELSGRGTSKLWYSLSNGTLLRGLELAELATAAPMEVWRRLEGRGLLGLDGDLRGEAGGWRRGDDSNW